MTKSIAFTAHGLPAAQGSKRHVGNGVMIESSKAVKPWRQDVVTAALEAIGKWEAEAGCLWEPFTGPVVLKVTFFFARPKSHYRTGRHSHELKPNAPTYVAKSPDLDKCVRSSADALTTAGTWRDDALLCRLVTTKVFATTPGAAFHLEELLP